LTKLRGDRRSPKKKKNITARGKTKRHACKTCKKGSMGKKFRRESDTKHKKKKTRDSKASSMEDQGGEGAAEGAPVSSAWERRLREKNKWGGKVKPERRGWEILNQTPPCGDLNSQNGENL